MKRNLLSLILIAILSLSTLGSASAGGWAVVHLDAMPADVRVGVPVEIGFTVMQHDVDPVNADSAVLSATHQESGVTLQSIARQEGDRGHYFVDATFPKAGGWKWSIIPAPFEGTSFETINVLGSDEAAQTSESITHPVHIHTGNCTELGEVVFPLSDLVDAGITQDGTPVPMSSTTNIVGEPIAISSTLVATQIADLTANPHAINVHLSVEEIGTYIACGAIGGPMWDGAVVVGLQSLNDSGYVGIATLREESGSTLVTIYLLPTRDPTTSASASEMVEVEISEDLVFTPSLVEISAGTTVTWTNRSAVAHTVAGKDLAFNDSGPFAAGESWSQTFTKPGTYQYFCGPHPYMTGVVVVN